jgi:two-component system sensor kinase FixL
MLHFILNAEGPGERCIRPRRQYMRAGDEPTMARSSRTAQLTEAGPVGATWPVAYMPFLRVAAAIFAAVVFVVDSFVAIDIAIAVLYVAVVIVSITFCDRRGVLAVSAVCMGLTVLAFLIQHHDEPLSHSGARCVVSLLAIAITTFLSVWIQSTTAALHSQARLLDLTHDAIFVRDVNDVITYWNRAAEDLYGWPAKSALGAVSHDLVKTVFLVPKEQITAQLLHAGHWEGDLVHTKRDGSKVTVSSRWSLQRDPRGHPVATLETNTDVEERRRAQENLAKAQAELAQLSRVSTLGELTASIAHEVNQPLAAVVTSGEASLRWLDAELPPLDRVKRGITRMIGDARRASDVVRRVRQLARKGDMQKAPISMNDVVEESVPLVRRELSSHQVSLALDLARPLPDIDGDRFLLQLVIINLMVNAVQAMASVEGSRGRVLTIRTRQDNDDQVLLSVEDNGPGFDPAVEADLFQAFFTTKPSGMGMGLAICRSIVEAHDGRIWASRNERGGSAFQFVIPRQGKARNEP